MQLVAAARRRCDAAKGQHKALISNSVYLKFGVHMFIAGPGCNMWVLLCAVQDHLGYVCPKAVGSCGAQAAGRTATTATRYLACHAATQQTTQLA